MNKLQKSLQQLTHLFHHTVYTSHHPVVMSTATQEVWHIFIGKTHRRTHSLTPSCSQTLRENSGSVTHPSGCCSVFLIVLICWKWQDISVLMTISITSVRSSLWEAQHSGSTELKAHALSQNRSSIPHRNGTSQDIMPAFPSVEWQTPAYLQSSFERLTRMFISSSCISL